MQAGTCSRREASAHRRRGERKRAAFCGERAERAGDARHVQLSCRSRSWKLNRPRKPKPAKHRVPPEQAMRLTGRYLMNTYRRPALLFVRGRGCYLYDHRGRKYLDFLGGLAVNALGYSHPRLTRVIRREAARAVHVSNLFHHSYQGPLACKLAEWSGLERVFFCNSGTEAVEGAIKLARLAAHKRGTEGKTRVLALENSFHGRTFAYQRHSGLPDIVVIAKPLAGGLPLGAVLARESFAESLSPGLHGSTFGGGPLACAVALEFLSTIEDDNLLENVRERGSQLRAELARLAGDFDFIREVRGEGLLLGIELAVEGKAYVEGALREGLIINCTHECVLRLLPPFIVTERQVDEFTQRFRQVLKKTKRPNALPAEFAEKNDRNALAASR